MLRSWPRASCVAVFYAKEGFKFTKKSVLKTVDISYNIYQWIYTKKVTTSLIKEMTNLRE